MPDFEDLADYLNQDLYWSESNVQFIAPTEMPFQQAFYSHRKLIREIGLEQYGGSHLYQAFIRRLCPSPSTIRDELSKYGKSCCTVGEPGPHGPRTVEAKVRKRFYDAARVVSKKVKTRKVKTSSGAYLECTVTGFNVKVRGQAL